MLRDVALLQAIVAADGRVKAVFDDNSVLTIEPNGAAFTATLPNGDQFQQLSSYVTSRFSSRLGLVLALRNTYVEQPFFCEAVRQVTAPHHFTRSEAPVPFASWSRDIAEAVEDGLATRLADGAVVIKSEEGSARLSLASHSLQFAITFPLLVAASSRPLALRCGAPGAGGATGGAHWEYVWQSQIFSCADCPPRWRRPLDLALAFRGVALGGGYSEDAQMKGVVAVATSAAVAEPGVARRSALPTAHDAVGACWESYPADSWWVSCAVVGYPPGVPLRLEWRPDALLRFIPDSRECEATLFSDDSCLVTSQGGKFLELFPLSPAAEGEQRRFFSAAAAPDAAAGWAPGSPAHTRVTLWALSERVAAFLSAAASAEGAPHHAAASTKARAPGEGAGADALSPSADCSPLSSEVVDEVVSVGVGRFTAYADGRVRCMFTDRTIAEVDSAGTFLQALMADGSSRVVRCSPPSAAGPDLEQHARAVLEFRAWAFRTPQERGEAIERARAVSAAVEAQLGATSRMAMIVAGGMGRPQTPATPAEGGARLHGPQVPLASAERNAPACACGTAADSPLLQDSSRGSTPRAPRSALAAPAPVPGPQRGCGSADILRWTDSSSLGAAHSSVDGVAGRDGVSAPEHGSVPWGAQVPYAARANVPLDRRHLPWWDGGDRERHLAQAGPAGADVDSGAFSSPLRSSSAVAAAGGGAASGHDWSDINNNRNGNGAARGSAPASHCPPTCWPAAGSGPTTIAGGGGGGFGEGGVLDREEMVARMLRLNERMLAEMAGAAVGGDAAAATETTVTRRRGDY